MMPKLLERSGTNQSGSITGLYTVLVDGDDMNEPIADAVRGILDGHFVLDRQLANRGQYPAVNVLKSVSRLMKDLVENDHLHAAKLFRQRLADYEQSEDLISLGAYKQGSSKDIDAAIHDHPAMLDFLKQEVEESDSFAETKTKLIQLFKQE